MAFPNFVPQLQAWYQAQVQARPGLMAVISVFASIPRRVALIVAYLCMEVLMGVVSLGMLAVVVVLGLFLGALLINAVGDRENPWVGLVPEPRSIYLGRNSCSKKGFGNGSGGVHRDTARGHNRHGHGDIQSGPLNGHGVPSGG
ncbi:hypothetical protein P170DRAFT_469183 [Aspergillus steynii IBT 23096]|uniref:Uncharacterized protein n=1 Tax=Aspergillus steynii IBT 23096 TaxID=1392250 RepID=A0A2I2GLD9_9EURO|nr:uncharacterized protein P170DRAFT_469183 [Aspergillus steynii IBT 23096]PLB53690.1 hypothetical protein P170DRAFT_469183 [Aspergillus steynii IBT 23096]